MSTINFSLFDPNETLSPNVVPDVSDFGSKLSPGFIVVLLIFNIFGVNPLYLFANFCRNLNFIQSNSKTKGVQEFQKKS